MLKNLGVVQACFHQPRFRYNAARKLGGRSVLEWVIRRVTDSIRLDGVIVVAPAGEKSELFAHLAPSDVPVFLCDEADPLGRFCKALEKYEAENVVRVRGDNLFIDPGMIDQLVATAEAHPNCDYVSYCSRDGRPAILSPVGVYAELFRTSALREVHRIAREPIDREQITRCIYSHPERFNLRLIPAPPEIDREDVRLLIDIEEDWDHVQVLFDALGPELLDWHRIAKLLDHQPAMRGRMAELNRELADV